MKCFMPKVALGFACGAVFFATAAQALVAAESEESTNDVQQSIQKLKNLTLDELLNERITIVSKTPEPLGQSASSVQVITGEEIQRSGAKSLPEALRLASNLEVAQANSHDWAISARGFNNTLANKLLVMIDGRAIYTPLYAGVFWGVQNVLLEDIDHIEVVSGPGGTLWGANAVNGVIHIITKSARDTQGTYVSAAAGSLLQDSGAVRYGGTLGSNVFYRVYGQRFDANNTLLANGDDAPDRWNMTQGGFRTDWYASEINTLTFQADFYGGSEEVAAGDTSLNGQNVLGRWTHTFSEESDLQIQGYFDRTWRDIPNSFEEDLKTYDLDFQHRFPLGTRQSIVWGTGYRLMQDRINNSPAFSFFPPNKNLQLFSGFVQDEITLVPDRLKFTMGTKLEHNDYSGLEVQPSARIAWTPDEHQTIWGGVSRAVRSPARVDTEIASPVVVGDPDFDSEKLIALELGYRVRPADRLSLSLASYYHFYEDLRSVDEPTPGSFILQNHFKGEIWGFELSGQYHVTDWWRLRAGYNYLNKHLWPHGGINVSPSIREGNDSENQFSFQSIVDLPAHFQFDTTGRYLSRLTSPDVDAYFSIDVRLAWRYKSTELSVVGQNLCEPEHSEFGTQQIPRSIYGKVTWRF